MNLQINEIKEIFQISSKLQNAFRHIRDLTGKYLEYQQNPYNSQLNNTNYPINQTYQNQQYYGPGQGYMPNYNVNGGYQQMNGKSINDKNQQKKMPPPQQRPVTPPLVKKNQPPHQQNFKPINPSSKPLSKHSIPLPPDSPSAVFFINKKQQILQQYPGLNNQQLKQIMQQVWKSFSAKQKQPYQKEYRRLKSQYQIKIKEGGGGNPQQSIIQAVKNQIKKNIN